MSDKPDATSDKPKVLELNWGEFKIELGDLVFEVGTESVEWHREPTVLDRYREVIARIDFSGFPMKYTIDVHYDSHADIASIAVTTRVHPRNNPGAFPEVLQSSRLCGFHHSPQPRFDVEVVRVVRDLLLQNLAHELDEQFYFDGRRIFDPHVLPEGTERGTP